MTNEETAGLLWKLIYAEWTLCLGESEVQRAAYRCAKETPPGALVIETSTAYRQPEKMECVGWLVTEAMEPFPGDFEGGPIPNELVFYIELLDGRLARWTNASFVAAVASESHCEFVSPSLRDAAWVAAAKDRHASLIARRIGSPRPGPTS